MLGSTTILTLVTLAGLVAGFAREWLLVANWGAGGATDAFLVAMFLPEAVRTTLAGGLLSAAGLPLWREIPDASRMGWLAGQVRHWLLVGCGVAVLLILASTWVVQLIGPGLSVSDSQQSGQALFWLALTIPGVVLQAILTIPLQARGHFLLPGLSSLLFNLPAVGYLWFAGTHATSSTLAQFFILGSVLMAVVLLPKTWQQGWRPLQVSNSGSVRQIWQRLWPLLASSGASQGLALMERMVASLLGEGIITVVNFARKLVNIPLIALMSLNQVLLSKMSGEIYTARRQTLDKGLFICTLLTLPAAAVLIGAAPALVTLLLPVGLANGPLPMLLALFAATITFGSWNALLARYYYADGDTRTPLSCELAGSALQACLLLLLPWLGGVMGIGGAVMGGVLSTATLLAYRLDKALLYKLFVLGAWSLMACGVSAGLLFSATAYGSWPQFSAATLYGVLVFIALVVWRRIHTK